MEGLAAQPAQQADPLQMDLPGRWIAGCWPVGGPRTSDRQLAAVPDDRIGDRQGGHARDAERAGEAAADQVGRLSVARAQEGSELACAGIESAGQQAQRIDVGDLEWASDQEPVQLQGHRFWRLRAVGRRLRRDRQPGGTHLEARSLEGGLVCGSDREAHPLQVEVQPAAVGGAVRELDDVAVASRRHGCRQRGVDAPEGHLLSRIAGRGHDPGRRLGGVVDRPIEGARSHPVRESLDVVHRQVAGVAGKGEEGVVRG